MKIVNSKSWNIGELKKITTLKRLLYLERGKRTVVN